MDGKPLIAKEKSQLKKIIKENNLGLSWVPQMNGPALDILFVELDFPCLGKCYIDLIR